MVCESCGDTLEEVENPYADEFGATLCDGCYYDEYMDDCPICCDRYEKTQFEAKQGEIIILLENDLPGYPENLNAGYYRVLKCPFFTAGIVGSSWFHTSALQKIADLGVRESRAFEECWSPSAPICLSCQSKHLAKKALSSPHTGDQEVNKNGRIFRRCK